MHSFVVDCDAVGCRCCGGIDRGSRLRRSAQPIGSLRRQRLRDGGGVGLGIERRRSAPPTRTQLHRPSVIGASTTASVLSRWLSSTKSASTPASIAAASRIAAPWLTTMMSPVQVVVVEIAHPQVGEHRQYRSSTSLPVLAAGHRRRPSSPLMPSLVDGVELRRSPRRRCGSPARRPAPRGCRRPRGQRTSSCGADLGGGLRRPRGDRMREQSRPAAQPGRTPGPARGPGRSSPHPAGGCPAGARRCRGTGRAAPGPAVRSPLRLSDAAQPLQPAVGLVELRRHRPGRRPGRPGPR